jgi:hypothetical protein
MCIPIDAAILEQCPKQCRAFILTAKMAAAAIRQADANLWLLNSSNFFDFSIDGMRHLRRFNVSTPVPSLISYLRPYPFNSVTFSLFNIGLWPYPL